MDRAKAQRRLMIYRHRSRELRERLAQTEDEHDREMIEDELAVFRTLSRVAKQITNPSNNSRQRRM